MVASFPAAEDRSGAGTISVGKPRPTRLFRLNPQYELVPIAGWHGLAAGQLAALRNASGLDAVILARAPGITIKAVCQATQDLLGELLDPKPLPGCPPGETDKSYHAAITRLVFESIVEVTDESGKFTSGAAAAASLWPVEAITFGKTAVDRLSRSALEYGAALGCPDALRLSARLYFFNGEPLTTAWAQRLRSQDAVRRHLGVGAGSAAAAIGSSWIAAPARSDNPGWLFWRSRSRPGPSRYKLYVSVRCEHLADVLPGSLAVADDHGATAVKVGRDAAALLRPDKLMLYFSTHERLLSAAHALRSRIEGAPAQGVPFTAALDDDGLLSWAMDPPRTERLFTWNGTSWRRWVCDRLASGLILGLAASSSTGPPPWLAALERLRLDGVDVSTWTPVGEPWNQAGE
jgi:hypothetical protein